ncbi:transposon Ty3-I Gag-Pol polyprotein [Nephila pilipes]|uniref:Transposon Ty3-I Gag-Pol polyprotein n=1 Tax=Nephila pilipes TaxID=299642 RepID=A0A8X6KG35_NEPPI|nr:transposon Ty3-I Gag-Pol polyprotein [Nephila pilipes]
MGPKLVCPSEIPSCECNLRKICLMKQNLWICSDPVSSGSSPDEMTFSRVAVKQLARGVITPRQLRYLDLISKFSTDIRYTKGCNNTIADILSRIEMDAISPTVIDFKEFASTQSKNFSSQQLLESNNSSLKISKEYFPLEDVYLCCDLSQKQLRPFVPKNMRHLVS